MNIKFRLQQLEEKVRYLETLDINSYSHEKDYFMCTSCGKKWGDGTQINLRINEVIYRYESWFCVVSAGGCGENTVKYFSGEDDPFDVNIEDNIEKPLDAHLISENIRLENRIHKLYELKTTEIDELHLHIDALNKQIENLKTTSTRTYKEQEQIIKKLKKTTEYKD